MTLDPLYSAIGWLLAQFYSVIPNLGVAIILLTFTIMLLLFPLTAKQAKSMIAMQRARSPRSRSCRRSTRATARSSTKR